MRSACLMPIAMTPSDSSGRSWACSRTRPTTASTSSVDDSPEAPSGRGATRTWRMHSSSVDGRERRQLPVLRAVDLEVRERDQSLVAAAVVPAQRAATRSADPRCPGWTRTRSRGSRPRPRARRHPPRPRGRARSARRRRSSAGAGGRRRRPRRAGRAGSRGWRLRAGSGWPRRRRRGRSTAGPPGRIWLTSSGLIAQQGLTAVRTSGARREQVADRQVADLALGLRARPAGPGPGTPRGPRPPAPPRRA